MGRCICLLEKSHFYILKFIIAPFKLPCCPATTVYYALLLSVVLWQIN